MDGRLVPGSLEEPIETKGGTIYSSSLLFGPHLVVVVSRHTQE
jgi:hypothetical protein